MCVIISSLLEAGQEIGLSLNTEELGVVTVVTRIWQQNDIVFVVELRPEHIGERLVTEQFRICFLTSYLKI